MLPLLMVQGSGVPTAGLTASKLQVVSPGKKPTPVTETVWATTPEVGLRVIDGPRTVNGAVTASMAPLVAVAVTLSVPAATSSTTNEPVNAPFRILQVEPDATGVPPIVHVVSLGAQPEPDTEICVPMCCGEAGVKTSVGE